MAQALVKGFNLQGKVKCLLPISHHRMITDTTPTTYNPYSPVSRQQFTTFIMQS